MIGVCGLEQRRRDEAGAGQLTGWDPVNEVQTTTAGEVPE